VKVKPSRYGYFKPPKKQIPISRRAVKWCDLILRDDIEKLSPKGLMKLFYDYHYLVVYPEPVGYIQLPTNALGYTDEAGLRKLLKYFQKTARGIIDDFKNAKSPLKYRMTTAFSVTFNRRRQCSMDQIDKQVFNYSYARQIAIILNGKQFDDVLRVCPSCNGYFIKVSGHNKQTCGHRCSVILAKKKRVSKNPILAKHQAAVSVFVSRLGTQGFTGTALELMLVAYLRKPGRCPVDYLPPYIDLLISPANKALLRSLKP
jgi:hypothetical protein